MTAATFAGAAPSAARLRRSGVAGTARYEYLMQVRRPAVWITLVALAALGWRGIGPVDAHTPIPDLMGTWALAFNIFTPVGVGVLLADRARRERRLGLDGLFDATPSGLGPRWWGKALGLTAATLTPVVCCWIGLTAVLAVQHGPGVIPEGILAFLAVTVPGLCFVCACSVALPLVVSPALYRAGFIGYWFWGNLLNPTRLPIPTLAGTPFEAIGEYASGGWFGGKTFEASNRGVHLDGALAGLNVGLLAAGTVAVLLATHFLLRRRTRP